MMGQSGAARNRRDAQAIMDLIDAVEARCMAADGPVTPTENEISRDETARLLGLAWKLARRVNRTPNPGARHRKRRRSQ